MPNQIKLLLLVSFLLLHAGCDNQSPDDDMFQPVIGTSDAVLSHDGIERSYFLYVPESYTGEDSVPLVFNFHGFGSNGFEQMFYGNFRPVADTVGFIVVHPQGTFLDGEMHWNVGGWTRESTADDIGFTLALLEELASHYKIDRKRVYATGMSNGGFMSFLLACQESETFAAAASVTGTMTTEMYDACDPSRPIPVMQFHGTADETVPYDGEGSIRSIVDTIHFWVDANNCDPAATETALPDVDPTDGSTITLLEYTGCDNGSVVKHFKIFGGGHTWPGSTIQFPNTNNDVDASREIWRFFDQYDLDGLRAPAL